jgi:hypothetical protein
MSLTRRKSMRAVDRAPSIVNRPSTSPIHLMTRPDAKKLSKTTGEDARQYSSFTSDGLFPNTLEENKAPRGHNDIDKELLAESRKAERAQLASLQDYEHTELEAELNRIIRLPLVDFLKIPPTTDPQTMITTLVTPAALRAVSPLSQSQQMLLSVRPQSASGMASGAVSPAQHLSCSPSALLARPTSSASQRPASAASSHLSSWPMSGGLRGGSAATPCATTSLVVPTTTAGSRPTTPLVYIGGRLNVDCTATLSRPTSAAAASPQHMLSVTSLSGNPSASGGVAARLGRQSSTKKLPLQQPLEEMQTPATPPPSSSIFHGGGGHLQLVFKGTEKRHNDDGLLEDGNGASSSLWVGGSSLNLRPSSTSSQYRLAGRVSPTSSSYRRASTAVSNGASAETSSHRPPADAVAVNDTSMLMSSSPYSHLLQRRGTTTSLARSQSPDRAGSPTPSSTSYAAGAASRMVHQRHQTQTRKQHGFNISTSYISHEPDAAMYDVALSAMLRSSSRPGSAAGNYDGGGGGASTGVANQKRPHSAAATSKGAAEAKMLSFPLRAVFLQ